MMTGGTSAAPGTTVIPVGGSIGGAKTMGAATAAATSGGGCSVAGVERSATRWGAILAFGAVVAEKLRRLVNGGDRPS